MCDNVSEHVAYKLNNIGTCTTWLQMEHLDWIREREVGEVGTSQLFYRVLLSVFSINKNWNIVQIQNVHNVVQSSLLI
jgi:hypothetical protein